MNLNDVDVDRLSELLYQQQVLVHAGGNMSHISKVFAELLQINMKKNPTNLGIAYQHTIRSFCTDATLLEQGMIASAVLSIIADGNKEIAVRIADDMKQAYEKIQNEHKGEKTPLEKIGIRTAADYTDALRKEWSYK